MHGLIDLAEHADNLVVVLQHWTIIQIFEVGLVNQPGRRFWANVVVA